METAYSAYMRGKYLEYGNLCKKCGACCGVSDNDPCIYLKEETTGRYICTIYENRFGMRRSISHREFTCVPIRDILHKSWSGNYNCAYKKYSS